jgi:hypothetical protein
VVDTHYSAWLSQLMLNCCAGSNTSPRSESISAVHQVHLGWAVTVTGPDSIRIQLQTYEGPSGED